MILEKGSDVAQTGGPDMGGHGSTRWGEHDKKVTVEDCRVLSVFRLARQGIADPGVQTNGECLSLRQSA